ncbi:MAG: hypothetical protein ABW252_22315 [Polyangiales bacterium]
MKTFAFARGSSGGRTYFVALHSGDPPGESGWSEYVQAVSVGCGMASGTVHILVVTDGGAPSAMQRRELAATFDRAPLPPFAHVFSDDAFVRGVVTAFRWLARTRFASHAPRDFVAVCADIGLAHEQVLYDFFAVQKTMSAVHTLRLVGESVVPARISLRS